MEGRQAPGSAAADKSLPRRGLRHSAASLRAKRTGGSRISLIVAFAANLVVAVAKLAAGLITGSPRDRAPPTSEQANVPRAAPKNARVSETTPNTVPWDPIHVGRAWSDGRSNPCLTDKGDRDAGPAA
jgi:hypothetical protein